MFFIKNVICRMMIIAIKDKYVTLRHLFKLQLMESILHIENVTNNKLMNINGYY